MHRRLRVLAACVALGLSVAASPAAKAQTLTTLYSFCAQSGCTDGYDPYAGLVQGSDGNFYGATYYGGADHNGTVFKITPSGTLTTLYSFCSQTDCPDGSRPYAGLVQGSDGNFYGTTYAGGASTGGTVFKITPSGALTTLYSFCAQSACTDGEAPYAGLVQGSDGNFYGTTYEGGAISSHGTVFKITPSGTLTTLYDFCAQSPCTDGYNPVAGLVQGSDGNFYGTTPVGGASYYYGTVFKITPSGALTTLYSFCAQSGCTDGDAPEAGLVQGSDGNFYGTTEFGGASADGTVFKITPSGTLTTLYSFCAQSGCTDGKYPEAGLVQGSDGNFYGTTNSGGAYAGGTVFKITPSGALTTLYSFCSQSGCTDGENPNAGLVQGTDGNFYGTTEAGGANGDGTVFKLVVATPAVSFSSNPLAFGGVAENSSSTLDLTITNSGTASLQITNFNITAGSPPFRLANTGTCNLEGQSLAAGSSCTVAITFAPTASGPFTGTFSLTDNASGSPQSVTVTGTGTAAVASVAPSSLTFGNQVLNTTSASQPVTVKNTGNGALTITSIATSADFGQTNNCNGSVAANGGSCTINVTFMPTATGTLTGTLTITDDNKGVTGSTQTVLLTGVGTVVKLSPLALGFRLQPFRTTSSPQIVTLTNIASTSLNISGISITAVGEVGGTSPGANLRRGPAAVDFAETNDCGTSVAPGASCGISVTFTPRAIGLARGWLAISDDGGGSPQLVSLSGDGF